MLQLNDTSKKSRNWEYTFFCSITENCKYAHLSMSIFEEETIKAKCSFEQSEKSHDNVITIYHTNSGHFSEKTFQGDLHAKNQGASFCGAGTHHQNGVI